MFKRTRIREWRKHRDLTQEQLAARIDMHPSNLSKLENGHIPYTQGNLEAIAEALNCRPSELLNDPPPDPADQALVAAFHEVPPDKRKELLDLFARMAKTVSGRAA